MNTYVHLLLQTEHFLLIFGKPFIMIVELSIKKDIYRDYLNHLFCLSEGIFQVKRDNDFSKFVCARVQYSNTPMRRDSDPGVVKLLLPKSRVLASASNYYLYFTKEDELKLNEELEATFNTDFDRYYLQGKKMNVMQKDIIQSFIISRKLIHLVGDNEMLKKRVYRDEVKKLKILNDKLIQKAYYRNELIEKGQFQYNDLVINGL